jgi:SPX domain protein involved in polyphosphate accumulation
MVRRRQQQDCELDLEDNSMPGVLADDSPHTQIFVERKTHREDWTGEKSVKARFAIAEHKANDFIAGRLTMDDEFDELVKRGKKTVKEVDSMKQLANEVQYAILTRGLKPGE